MSGFKGTKIKELLRLCSEIEHGNYLGGYFDPSLVSVENELDSLVKINTEMLEMLDKSLEVIRWYMENSIPDENHEDFFNIGMNQREELENIIKYATEL